MSLIFDAQHDFKSFRFWLFYRVNDRTSLRRASEIYLFTRNLEPLELTAKFTITYILNIYAVYNKKKLITLTRFSNFFLKILSVSVAIVTKIWAILSEKNTPALEKNMLFILCSYEWNFLTSIRDWNRTITAWSMNMSWNVFFTRKKVSYAFV